jgi:Tetracyclin repressor-like, C-terminal domain
MKLDRPFKSLDPTQPLAGKRLERAEFAHIQQSVSFSGWDFDRAFEFGLSVILGGVGQHPKSKPRGGRGARTK